MSDRLTAAFDRDRVEAEEREEIIRLASQLWRLLIRHRGGMSHAGWHVEQAVRHGITDPPTIPVKEGTDV